MVALFAERLDLSGIRSFRVFQWTYHIGIPLTAVMLLVRGIVQVQGLTLSKGASAAISGIAGIGYILTGVGIVLLLISLKKAAKN